MADTTTSEELWTPASKVTLARILLIPLFVAALVAPWPDFFPAWMDMPTVKPWLAAFIFIILSATDSLDGYLARSRGEVTDFGKFMDPFADKLLVTAALLGLIELDVLPSWVALIIIAREFIVSGVRMVAANKGEVIAASWYGKVKTVLQMVAIVLFIVKDSHVISDFHALAHDWLYLVSWLVMFAALVMTVLSMADYLYKARHLLGFGRPSRRRRSQRSDGTAGTEEGQAEKAAEPVLDAGQAARNVVEHASAKGLKVGTAESCTGGLVAAAITSVPGSSAVMEGSVVSYSNAVKSARLDVSEAVLAEHGAVSEQTACQMALGARQALGVDVAVSTTGIAGPGGGSASKPVGTVWIGVARDDGAQARLFTFDGTRDQVREQAVLQALLLLDSSLAD